MSKKLFKLLENLKGCLNSFQNGQTFFKVLISSRWYILDNPSSGYVKIIQNVPKFFFRSRTYSQTLLSKQLTPPSPPPRPQKKKNKNLVRKLEFMGPNCKVHSWHDKWQQYTTPYYLLTKRQQTLNI